MLLHRCLRVISSVPSRCIHLCRPVAANLNNANRNKQIQVEVSADGSIIACWHPEPAIPYEDTMPLPRRLAEASEGDSVLKVQDMVDSKYNYNEDGPPDYELMRMFHTDRAFWRHRLVRHYGPWQRQKERKAV